MFEVLGNRINESIEAQDKIKDEDKALIQESFLKEVKFLDNLLESAKEIGEDAEHVDGSNFDDSGELYDDVADDEDLTDIEGLDSEEDLAGAMEITEFENDIEDIAEDGDIEIDPKDVADLAKYDDYDDIDNFNCELDDMFGGVDDILTNNLNSTKTVAPEKISLESVEVIDELFEEDFDFLSESDDDFEDLDDIEDDEDDFDTDDDDLDDFDDLD